MLSDLLSQNKEWADQLAAEKPEFFPTLAKQQAPEYLWIGCADSRVPANQIVGLMPGEMFVHRNIANVVVHTDLNCLSVMQFAVDVLKVKHIIVCGHYSCGGVKASLEDAPHGLIDNWLQHIRDVYRNNKSEVDAITDEHARVDRMCELNVIDQVRNVCQTTVIKSAWERGQQLAVHGWIYGLKNGYLTNLDVTATSPDQIP